MSLQEEIKSLKERVAETEGYDEDEQKFIDWCLGEFGEGTFYELDKYYDVEEETETAREEHVNKFTLRVEEKIMNVQEQIKVLKEQISSSQELLTKLEDQIKKEQEFPQFGDDYWYVDSDTEVMDTASYAGEYDQGRLSIGNVFKTKEQAEFAVEKLKVEAELREFSRPFEYGENCTEFYYGHDFGRIMFCTLTASQTQGAIYFESREKAEEAIDTVGEERIKKYIFEVE